MLKVTGIPVLFASLCCMGPLILVLLGLSGVAFAASLTDVLYGQYRWAFRGLGLALLAVSLFIYFRTKGICTIDQVKRKRRFVLNTILIALITGIVLYIFWLYVVVEIIGKIVGIWG